MAVRLADEPPSAGRSTASLRVTLIYRLNAGRNGGCPALAVGITPKAVTDCKLPGMG